MGFTCQANLSGFFTFNIYNQGILYQCSDMFCRVVHKWNQVVRDDVIDHDYEISAAIMT